MFLSFSFFGAFVNRYLCAGAQGLLFSPGLSLITRDHEVVGIIIYKVVSESPEQLAQLPNVLSGRSSKLWD